MRGDGSVAGGTPRVPRRRFRRVRPEGVVRPGMEVRGSLIHFMGVQGIWAPRNWSINVETADDPPHLDVINEVCFDDVGEAHTVLILDESNCYRGRSDEGGYVMLRKSWSPNTARGPLLSSYVRFPATDWLGGVPLARTSAEGRALLRGGDAGRFEDALSVETGQSQR